MSLAPHCKPSRAADCVEQCWRGGASVGHPEWQPQRAVSITSKVPMIWMVENPEAVKNFRLPRCRSAAHLILAKEIVHVERMAAL